MRFSLSIRCLKVEKVDARLGPFFLSMVTLPLRRSIQSKITFSPAGNRSSPFGSGRSVRVRTMSEAESLKTMSPLVASDSVAAVKFRQPPSLQPQLSM